MAITIALLLAGIVAWFFLSGTYSTSVKDPETLRDSEIEDAYIELKRKILATSAYDNEQTYRRIYFRMKALLGQIIERHKHFVLDVEASAENLHRLFRREEHRDSNGMPYHEYAVPRDLDMRDTSPEVLLYLCFFLWLGGQAKGIGNVSSDPRLMLSILDFLISEKSFAPASFFKGLVMKYGTEVQGRVDSSAARALFGEAQKQGVGAAAIELQRLDKFALLDSLPSVHPG